MATLDNDPRVERLLSAWVAASARMESGPGIECLTAEEIARFLETRRGRGIPEEARVARARAADHLSECSYCTREVVALFRARRERQARMQSRAALGERVDRVAACVRIAVRAAQGAFTHLDGLIVGLGGPARLLPASPAFGHGALRGEGEDLPVEEEEHHEVIVSGEGLAAAELLLSQDEEEHGAITVTLQEPLEVALISPDGRAEPLPVVVADGRYYATITSLPEGEYYLALLRQERDPPSPPGG